MEEERLKLSVAHRLKLCGGAIVTARTIKPSETNFRELFSKWCSTQAGAVSMCAIRSLP
jgi:hypothetical protein